MRLGQDFLNVETSPMNRTKRNVQVRVTKDCFVYDDLGNEVNLRNGQILNFKIFDAHQRHTNGESEEFGWVFRLMPGTYEITRGE